MLTSPLCICAEYQRQPERFGHRDRQFLRLTLHGEFSSRQPLFRKREGQRARVEVGDCWQEQEEEEGAHVAGRRAPTLAPEWSWASAASGGEPIRGAWATTILPYHTVHTIEQHHENTTPHRLISLYTRSTQTHPAHHLAKTLTSPPLPFLPSLCHCPLSSFRPPVSAFKFAERDRHPFRVREPLALPR